jgi:hypothetical protein
MQKYGFLRPIISKVIYQYLDCGILANVFARVRCPSCKYEYLLAFSCYRHLGTCLAIIRIFIYFVPMGALGAVASFMQLLLVLTALALNRYLPTRYFPCLKEKALLPVE